MIASTRETLIEVSVVDPDLIHVRLIREVGRDLFQDKGIFQAAGINLESDVGIVIELVTLGDIVGTFRLNITVHFSSAQPQINHSITLMGMRVIMKLKIPISTVQIDVHI